MDTKPQTEKRYSALEVPKAIWHFLGEHKRGYVTFNILLFAVGFYDLVPTYIVGKIVDFFTHYTPGDSLKVLYTYIFFVGISSIGIAFIRLTAKNRLGRISIAARTNARIEGFERLMDFSLQWHNQENSGNKVQRIFTGSQSIQEWSFLVNNSLFPVLTAFIGVLSIFLFLSPIFLLFFAVYSSCYFGIEYVFNRKLGRLSTEVNTLNEKSSGSYIEGAGNILAIKALGAEQGLQKQVRTSEEATKKKDIARVDISIRKWYTFQTLNGLALIVFLVLVAKQFLAGVISVGYVLIFFSYFEKLRNATNQGTDVSSKVAQLKADLLRMMPIFLEKSHVSTGHKLFPKNWENIRITHGNFKYNSGQAGIQNMNFVLHKNEKLGVAGLSGSGKSTLVKVLLGLYELDGGSFLVGNTNYYDIEHTDMAKHIAVVLQETELFNFSLKDNITMMREVDPELLQTAIQTAHLEGVVNKLPEGLETLIGERGYTLSGGERQRLGIARAIYKNAPILIFDEATSALDSKTEQLIMENLLKNLKQKTMLIIAHRLSTLQNTNRILVFEQGSIVEEGAFHDLKDKPVSKFGQLYKLQHP